jgi:Zn-dependent protease
MRADLGHRPAAAQAATGGGLRHGSLPLGRWEGILVEAHWSALGTLGLFGSILATTILPEGHAGESRVTYWLVGAVASAVFLTTVIAHELAHAVVARHHGIKVDRITLWFLGGVTQLGGASPSPRADAAVAVAGPAASLSIGTVFGCLAWWMGDGSVVATAALWLAAVNILIGFFNLLPGAPLDGGRLIRAIAWWRLGDRRAAGLVATRTGRILGIMLLLLGPVEMLAGRFAGLWLVLLGLFIMGGARAEEDAAGDDGPGADRVRRRDSRPGEGWSGGRAWPTGRAGHIRPAHPGGSSEPVGLAVGPGSQVERQGTSDPQGSCS